MAIAERVTGTINKLRGIRSEAQLARDTVRKAYGSLEARAGLSEAFRIPDQEGGTFDVHGFRPHVDERIAHFEVFHIDDTGSVQERVLLWPEGVSHRDLRGHLSVQRGIELAAKITQVLAPQQRSPQAG